MRRTNKLFAQQNSLLLLVKTRILTVFTHQLVILDFFADRRMVLTADAELVFWLEYVRVFVRDAAHVGSVVLREILNLLFKELLGGSARALVSPFRRVLLLLVVVVRVAVLSVGCVLLGEASVFFVETCVVGHVFHLNYNYLKITQGVLGFWGPPSSSSSATWRCSASCRR